MEDTDEITVRFLKVVYQPVRRNESEEADKSVSSVKPTQSPTKIRKDRQEETVRFLSPAK